MNEHEYKFGANILENLTTGMYQDSRTIYREYIQNACDSIDEAIRSEILTEVDAEIKITIDRQNRKIVIEDNAMGIPDEKFESILGNIADSEKRIGVNRGFRGIGRLCGLAYCKTLRFTSKFKGEPRERSMTCDAEKMRALFAENLSGEKHSAQQVLNLINEFAHRQAEDPSAHYFRVELIDINNENTDLLDIDKVKTYLSFVAPVDYQPSFSLQSEIKNHASELGFKIETYKIRVNGSRILKRYQTQYKTKNRNDEIFGVEFRDLIDIESGEILAWAWWGKSNYKGVIAIDDNPPMRGLRLRAGNIQIGGENALEKFFPQERGTTYFIGEVFIMSKDLIPNSQRDYLNENQTRLHFEKLMEELGRYLHKVYYDASKMRSAIKKIEESKRAQREFDEMKAQGKFVSEEHLREEQEKLDQKKSQAVKAAESLERIQRKLDDKPQIISEIFSNVEEEIIDSEQPTIEVPTEEKKFFREEKLQHLPEHDREMLKKIFEIIRNSTPEETSTMLIDKIEDEFK